MQQQLATTVTDGHSNAALQDPQNYAAVKPHDVSNYKQCQSIGSGALLIFSGICSIIFMIADFCIVSSLQYEYDSFYFVGYGIWVGTVFVIAGVLGIGAGVKSTKCMITAFAVFSSIAVCLAPVQFGLGAASALLTLAECEPYSDCEHESDEVMTSVAMEGTVAVSALFGLAAGIWALTVCCAEACCKTSQTTVVPVNVGYYGAPVVHSASHHHQGPMAQTVFVAPATGSGYAFAPYGGYVHSGQMSQQPVGPPSFSQAPVTGSGYAFAPYGGYVHPAQLSQQPVGPPPFNQGQQYPKAWSAE